MDKRLRELLDQVESVPDFVGISLLDINDTNSLGDNALHCVCVWGDIAAVKLLVENGIDIHKKGEGGITPIKLAHDFGHTDVVDYLLSCGAKTAYLEAEFTFDPDADARHMNMLKQGIEKLEEGIKNECGHDA